MTSKPLILFDLPLEVANQVLEKLEPVEILISRKVCRSLRSAIDKNIHFNKISIELWIHSVSFYFDKIEIIYRNAFNSGSYMEYNGQRKTIEGVNYMETAFTDLKILLKNALDLTIYGRVKERLTVSFLVDILKENVNIHVETLTLNCFSIDDVLLMLPLLNAETLQEISFWEVFEIGQLEKITHLDQWKNAKIFKLWDSCEYIEYLFHFEDFSIETDEFPIQSAIKVRDDLLQRSTFQICTFFVLKFNLKPVELARVFQSDYAGGDEFKLDYSNGKFKFEINFGYCPFESHLWEFEIKRC